MKGQRNEKTEELTDRGMKGVKRQRNERTEK